jgi:predicted phage-related endonuclease
VRIASGEQGGGSWLNARCGKISASGIQHILAKGRGGKESLTRIAYRNQLISERLTGVLSHGYQACEMELPARCMYEITTGTFVDQVGFILHPKWDFAGASPDGLIDEDGGLEIKCYASAVHEQWVRGDKVPNAHVAQMMWNMVCTGRKWWDFCSYDPRQDEGQQLFIRRLEFDEAKAASLEIAVWQFNEEIEAELKELRKVVPMVRRA